VSVVHFGRSTGHAISGRGIRQLGLPNRWSVQAVPVSRLLSSGWAPQVSRRPRRFPRGTRTAISSGTCCSPRSRRTRAPSTPQPAIQSRKLFTINLGRSIYSRRLFMINLGRSIFSTNLYQVLFSRCVYFSGCADVFCEPDQLS